MTVPTDYDPADYAPFAVTVDAVVFTHRSEGLHVLLVVRGHEPWKGRWALPGGFVDIGEDLPAAAKRELAEETSIKLDSLDQLGAYGNPDRDPRMRIVTVAYMAYVEDLPDPVGGDDAADALLVPVSEVLADPERLASDHHRIITEAVERLRR